MTRDFAATIRNGLKLMPNETNGAKGNKAALRNFTFTKEADAELVRLKLTTGKNMTAILEDLLLQRRQFSAPVETWLDAEAARTCRRAPKSSNGCWRNMPRGGKMSGSIPAVTWNPL